MKLPRTFTVEGRVELYTCSPSGPVLGRTLPLKILGSFGFVENALFCNSVYHMHVFKCVNCYGYICIGNTRMIDYGELLEVTLTGEIRGTRRKPF